MITLLISAIASGQTPSSSVKADPLKPSAPHERMSFFEGTWSMEPPADSKAGAMPFATFEETCSWLPGARRHMVCRSLRQRTGESVRREAIYVLSYQEHDSTYIAHFAFPTEPHWIIAAALTATGG
jgi:hypothetical protein